MNAIDTYNQLSKDLSKLISILKSVRTIEEIHIERHILGYKYNSDKDMHEYWIALSIYSVSNSLSYLAYVINAIEEIVPIKTTSKAEIEGYVESFIKNETKVLTVLESIIDKPNQIFIGYSEPITMEEYLEKIVIDIHDEANNLDWNYKKLQSDEN